MSRSLNLSLTDELRKFVDENSGDGTLFATPSEFVRSLIREKKSRSEITALREAMLEGYGDIARGRTVAFSGNLRTAMADGRRLDKDGVDQD